MSRPSSTKCTCYGKGRCSYCLNKKSRPSTSSSLPSNLFTKLQRDDRYKSKAESSKRIPSIRPSEKPSSASLSSRDVAKSSKPKYENSSAKISESKYASISDERSKSKYGSVSAEASKSKYAEISPKSTFKTKHDVEMAKRQTSIKTLPREEQEKQEDWAQTQLKKNASSNCPAGLIWIRFRDGYRCLGGAHMVTDKLIAEGKGGWYRMHAMNATERFGPYYEPDPNFVYMSEEEKKQMRIMCFGTENPTVEDAVWKSW